MNTQTKQYFVPKDSEGGGGCPFCRAEIKGTEHIIVDPFTPEPESPNVGVNMSKNTSSGEEGKRFIKIIIVPK